MDKEAENAELVLVHAVWSADAVSLNRLCHQSRFQYWRHGGNGALNLHDLRPANNSLDPVDQTVQFLHICC